MEVGGVQCAILLLCVILQGHVSGYPSSVPESPDTCSKMIPGHGPRPQQTTTPYKIVLNKYEVTAGNKIEITITGKKGATFKGFYMQVRDEDGTPIGTFLIPDEKEAGTHNCFKLKNNAVHHKHSKDKKSVTVYWKAPENFTGKVKVLATVLKDFETYWTNVQAKDLVSVSKSSSKIFFTSPGLLEKETEESSAYSKTARILNYNPYSPISQFSPWDYVADTSESIPSESFLSEEPSREPEKSALGRQLGPLNFDFHGGLYSSKIPSRQSKKIFPGHPEPGIPPNSPFAQFPSYYPQKPLGSPQPSPPSSILDKLEQHQPPSPPKPPVKSELHGVKNPYFHTNPKNHHLPPPLYFPETPYPYQYSPPIPPSSEIEKNPLVQNHNPTIPIFEDSPLHQIHHVPPHMTQSVYDKGGHYVINHHHISNSAQKYHHPFYHSSPHLPPPPQKPASDPSYPNSGYFPKDILTKLTSYIPNIYNALTNNPLFNFNIDNTIESIWKPSKGVPFKNPGGQLGPHPSASIEMPKYGYLIYNPVRKDPYFVIPAANEEEFVASHLVRRSGQVPPPTPTHS